MGNGMHQMGFSETYTTVNKERIVDFTRRFRHCKGCSVCQIVVFSDYEGVKGISWIQICVLNSKLADGIGIIFDQFFLCWFLFYVIF